MPNQKQKNTPGFTEFYLGVLYGSAYNFFTPRNKFKISWSDANPNYNSSYAPAAQYKTLSKQILEVFQNFKLYIDHIDLPGLQIKGGDVINDGKGPYYMQGDHMLSPETNEVVVWFRETMISISDLAYIWINFNATPWVRPLKLNLNIDYYSDFDGKTSVMAYKLDGCRPIELDMINARHDGKEVLLRGIKMGFNTITPVECNGGKNGTSAIMSNWNQLLEQMKKTQDQEQKNNSTVFDELGKSWDQSSGFFGTIGGAASTIVTGKAVAVDSAKEETAIKDFVTDNWVTNVASKSWDFAKSVFTSDKNTEGNNVKLPEQSQNTKNLKLNESPKEQQKSMNNDAMQQEYENIQRNQYSTQVAKQDEKQHEENQQYKTQQIQDNLTNIQKEPSKDKSVPDISSSQSNVNNTDSLYKNIPFKTFSNEEGKIYTPTLYIDKGSGEPQALKSFSQIDLEGKNDIIISAGNIGFNISKSGNTATIVTFNEKGVIESVTVEKDSIEFFTESIKSDKSSSGFSQQVFSINAKDTQGKPISMVTVQEGREGIPTIYSSNEKNITPGYKPLSEDKVIIDNKNTENSATKNYSSSVSRI